MSKKCMYLLFLFLFLNINQQNIECRNNLNPSHFDYSGRLQHNHYRHIKNGKKEINASYDRVIRKTEAETKSIWVHESYFDIFRRNNSPVPVQFDWDKIRTEMKPVKMARKEAQHAQKKSPKKKIRSNWRYFELFFFYYY